MQGLLFLESYVLSNIAVWLFLFPSLNLFFSFLVVFKVFRSFSGLEPHNFFCLGLFKGGQILPLFLFFRKNPRVLRRQIFICFPFYSKILQL